MLADCLELLIIKDTVFVLVNQGKHTPEAVFGLGLTNAGPADIDELVKCNGFGLLLQSIDQVENEGRPSMGSELLENSTDFNGINSAAMVLVEHFKGVLELLIVLRVEAVLPLSGSTFVASSWLGNVRSFCSAHWIRSNQ